ncbi:MAG TPA: hypothetical protein VFE82_07340 [Ramlibacter sp.]|jgi:hypothetical protein|uniref:hypothetical protein n=1 Tax=Ramlibacter sp. TaxID=1917967 RepID=UPI002D2BDA9A|nr:hypothetical protein [Ramlibacter sp.]HZY18279.1 hypothetical protein [Ramlibacter sp.]
MKAAAFTTVLALLVGCNQQGGALGDVRQTRAPGHVAAGGRTSGEVMAASPAPKAADGAPAGTPGIPQGAEGNTGGTSIGGMPPQAGNNPPAAPPMPVRSEKAGTAAPSEDVKTGRNVQPPGVRADSPTKAPQQ